MFLYITLVGIVPVTVFAQPFVISGADTPSAIDDLEVLDEATGLIWQRCTFGRPWTGLVCGAGTGPIYTHEQALVHAQNARTATKAWRLPNIKELASIIDWTQRTPSIDSAAFPNTMWTVNYWSATPNVQDPTSAFSVNFYAGTVSPRSRSEEKYIRFVRESEQFIK
jgi:hypothetical protein